MRQYRSSGSVEGVMGNHDSYSDNYISGPFEAVHRLSRVGLVRGLLGSSAFPYFLVGENHGEHISCRLALARIYEKEEMLSGL